MGKLEMCLWATDFIITGLGYVLGGPTAAMFCFLVGGILIFFVLAKEDKNVQKPPKLKKWHRYGMGTFALLIILLIGFAVVRAVTWKNTPQPSAQTQPPPEPVTSQAPPAAMNPQATKQTTPKHVASKKPVPVSSTSASGDNSSAISGGVNQGPGSIAQIGGTGNTATVNNAPPQRRMSPDQRSSLAACLRGHPNRASVYVNSAHNFEAQTYSDDFIAALKDGGWNVGPYPIALQEVKIGSGIQMGVYDPDNPPPAMEILKECLSESGVGPDAIAKTGLVAKDEVLIYVGVPLKQQ